ncbi:hypothetical protein RRG08_058619 [Elysia crispata]|uniref:Uncharacterized protein n=1 Tax=Elysia crispata TaxID=231223 RepID=A0AAE1D7X2_9GAST|nr:hypothetical protein RRG08_058619 [Elysia crispata]
MNQQLCSLGRDRGLQRIKQWLFMEELALVSTHRIDIFIVSEARRPAAEPDTRPCRESREHESDLAPGTSGDLLPAQGRELCHKAPLPIPI